MNITELRKIARRMDPAGFAHQVGPFALVQRPPKALVQLASEQLGVRETIPFERGKRVERALELVLSFEQLVIATLPPVREKDTLTVGRLPDCDLVVENPSVSKRHAVLSWDTRTRTASVTDLESRNGTRLDGRPIPRNEPRPLQDGEVVSFGDVDYWFLHAETLHRRLTQSAG